MGLGLHEVAELGKRLGPVEAYLSLIVSSVSLFAVGVGNLSDGRVVVGSILSGIAYGLAVGGYRFGRGPGRVVAQAAMSTSLIWPFFT